MKTCQVDGCEKKCSARGLCSNHYAVARDRGEFGHPPCSIEGCERPGVRKGLCRSHRDQSLGRGPQFTARQRLRRYGVSDTEYARLLSAQDGLCGICRRPPLLGLGKTSQSRQLDLDHDHETGLVRGLLCIRCNRAIGLFRDRADLILNAIAYLHDPPAQRVLGQSNAE